MGPLWVYLGVLNVATFVAFVVDKRRAERHRRRIRELTLMGMSLLGGAAGGLVAMYLVRHKTRVWYFRWGLPAMIVLHVALFVYARATGLV